MKVQFPSVGKFWWRGQKLKIFWKFWKVSELIVSCVWNHSEWFWKAYVARYDSKLDFKFTERSKIEDFLKVLKNLRIDFELCLKSFRMVLEGICSKIWFETRLFCEFTSWATNPRQQKLAGDQPKNWRANNPRTGGRQPKNCQRDTWVTDPWIRGCHPFTTGGRPTRELAGESRGESVYAPQEMPDW